MRAIQAMRISVREQKGRRGEDKESKLLNSRRQFVLILEKKFLKIYRGSFCGTSINTMVELTIDKPICFRFSLQNFAYFHIVYLDLQP